MAPRSDLFQIDKKHFLSQPLWLLMLRDLMSSTLGHQCKDIKGLKTQNLRDHMSEAELIFTALAELSTRQIAESVSATGMPENAEAGKKGGKIARKARLELESKTGKSVITSENYLPPAKKQGQIKQKPDNRGDEE
jgi:CRISPR/Cas system CSM-associated protein Csm4 (group 5 of RAMP superfamily)